MSEDYDYKKFIVLYVDDEEMSLKYFNRAFSDQFRILTAPTAQEGLRLLEQHADEIGLLMTDQRMPGEKGVWLLERARQLRPRIVRILATAYSDMTAAIEAVNSGAIYKYITKPWDPPQLETTIKRGLEFFIVQCERDQLLNERMTVLHRIMMADRIMSLGSLAAGLSHHVRNSLVAVKTFLDLVPIKLKEETVDINSLRNPEFWRDYYQKVQDQIEKINGMLKDLWTASEKPTYEFRDEVRLRDLIEQVAGELAQDFAAKGITLVNDVPPTLPPLLVNGPQFHRLIELLLKDELVSLPAGCRVTVSAQSVSDGLPGRPELRMELSDNGPGLPEEALQQLFDPFLVRSDTPLEYGLNLMACFFIVHHHGGKIRARSSAEHGTTFSLRLPFNAGQPDLTSTDTNFLQKVIHNDQMWEKVLASQ